jgi:hypothetical protein
MPEMQSALRLQGELRKVKQLMDSGDGDRALSCIKSMIAETPWYVHRVCVRERVSANSEAYITCCMETWHAIASSS